ncbi:MAG: hypothetical protein JWM39_775 [Parcubacteria group bacterium]|nr:hypothetical protein [Parcubacteria group bacterium]
MLKRCLIHSKSAKSAYIRSCSLYGALRYKKLSISMLMDFIIWYTRKENKVLEANPSGYIG